MLQYFADFSSQLVATKPQEFMRRGKTTVLKNYGTRLHVLKYMDTT